MVTCEKRNENRKGYEEKCEESRQLRYWETRGEKRVE